MQDSDLGSEVDYENSKFTFFFIKKIEEINQKFIHTIQFNQNERHSKSYYFIVK